MNEPTHPSRNAPPGSFAALLLWWGLLTDHLVVGVVLALVTEARHLVASRWEINDRQAGDAWILSVLLIGGSLIRGLGMGPIVGYYVVGWLPATLAPLLLVQLYGNREAIPRRVFYSVLNRVPSKAIRRSIERASGRSAVNIELPYLGVVLLSAGAVDTTTGPQYFLGAAAALAWVLFTRVPRAQANPLVAVTAFAGVLAAGHTGHVGLHALQGSLERWIGFNATEGFDPNSNAAVTAIGEVGELKLSGNIEWRYRQETGTPPQYLRRATFNTYHNRTWYNLRGGSFRRRERQADANGAWVLASPSADSHRLRGRLRAMSSERTVQLPLPMAPLSIAGLAAESLSTNELGVVRAQGLSVPAELDVEFEFTPPRDAAPTTNDLEVPRSMSAQLDRILARLRISRSTSASETVRAVHDYFARNFRYSTYTPLPAGETNTLARFLDETRSGHCEYFATATVLLLRRAGIAARYVTGYAVEEHDRGSGEYVLRGLHAHAWSLAWVDGRWTTVDNTPATWVSAERDTVSLLQPIKDRLQDWQQRWSAWSGGLSSDLLTRILTWAVLPLLVLFLWYRVFRGGRQRAETLTAPAKVETTGADSEWYLLERALEDRLGRRPRDVTVRSWWDEGRGRIESVVAAELDRVVDLHYRLRFDPRGLQPTERDDLRQRAESCRALLARNDDDSRRSLGGGA